MTIGADSALTRITEAVDAIISTAASHQRTFVVKVMGRDCGYLALMAGLACSADWVFIPELPPNPGEWEDQMCALLKSGRESGRRDSIVIMAEGARDTEGNPISSDYVKKVLEERLGEDCRITILGHLQQGGNPSPHDRILAIRLARLCIEYLVQESLAGKTPASFIGMQKKEVTFVSMSQWPELVDEKYQLPKEQWWMNLREIAKTMNNPPEGVEF